MSITVSLCMIVKNEESVLNRCLSCIKDIADEIIILDTGSTDNTKNIALQNGAKVYDFIWCDDFAKARNKAFSYASSDYILWLDADDILTDENIIKLKKLKQDLDNTVDAVSMIYGLVDDYNGNTTISLKRNRLVKTAKNFRWIGCVHEYLEVYGNIIQSDIEIKHKKIDFTHSDRNLKIFESMKQNGKLISPRDIFYYANELFDNRLYSRAIEEYILFLTQADIWIEDKKTASLNLAQCYLETFDESNCLNILIGSLSFDIPRSDICCKVAEIFSKRKNYATAIFWYKNALNCIPPIENMGLQNKSFYSWIPAIELCVCYFEIEDYISAYYFNELAADFNADKAKIEHNRKFIIEKLNSKNIPIPKLQKNIFLSELKY